MKKIIAALAIAVGFMMLFGDSARAEAATDEGICSALDEVPSILVIGAMLIENGETPRQAGTDVAKAVIYTCPRHMDLLEKFIETYG